MSLEVLNATVLALRNASINLGWHKSCARKKNTLDLALTTPAADVVSIPVVAIALLLSLFSFLYDLGRYPLLDNNEGLYAEIAREMLETGNFIIPHLLGVPYLEKPPLLYWLMAASFYIFGPTAASARLISASAMLVLAMMLLLFCRRLGNLRVGIYALLIFSTTVPATLVSRTVIFDPLLTMLIGACLLSYLQWYRNHKRSWIYTAAIFLALATLEKGGVAIILVAGIIIFFPSVCASEKRYRP
ncbi:hypothetical protein BH11PSE12_BH11PSE12_04630 [soil metagenome]